jgi:hypothetical protein
MVQFSFT